MQVKERNGRMAAFETFIPLIRGFSGSQALHPAFQSASRRGLTTHQGVSCVCALCLLPPGVPWRARRQNRVNRIPLLESREDCPSSQTLITASTHIFYGR